MAVTKASFNNSTALMGVSIPYAHLMWWCQASVSNDIDNYSLDIANNNNVSKISTQAVYTPSIKYIHHLISSATVYQYQYLQSVHLQYILSIWFQYLNILWFLKQYQYIPESVLTLYALEHSASFFGIQFTKYVRPHQISRSSIMPKEFYEI